MNYCGIWRAILFWQTLYFKLNVNIRQFIMFINMQQITCMMKSFSSQSYFFLKNQMKFEGLDTQSSSNTLVKAKNLEENCVWKLCFLSVGGKFYEFHTENLYICISYCFLFKLVDTQNNILGLCRYIFAISYFYNNTLACFMFYITDYKCHVL